MPLLPLLPHDHTIYGTIGIVICLKGNVFNVYEQDKIPKIHPIDMVIEY